MTNSAINAPASLRAWNIAMISFGDTFNELSALATS